MAFPDRLKLSVAFDPALLAADLATLTARAWTPHFVEQNFEGEWSVIALRAPKGTAGQHPIRQIYSDPSVTEFEDTPAMRACPHLASAAGAFGPAHAVRLMRLTPGSVIKEHGDHDLAAEEGMARIHVPVTTNPDVIFEVNRRRVDMAPGEAWYLRLADPHRVANRGTADRVHLVIDVPLNATLEALMRRAMAQAAGQQDSAARA
jgi:aspartyl/asparaginyl beta-hydroxylase